MAKTLRIVRISLVTLQLISLTVAAVILVVHYNPWIERIIEEAEKTTTGNGSQGSQNGSPPAPDEVVSQLGHSLAEQINRVEGEEIVLFLMSAATILVSLLGIVGTLRGSLSPATSKVHHQHNCLLNFYMSTLIVFLFVIFMALCGTLWEVISKLQAASHGSSGTSVGVHLSGTVVASTANPFESAYDLVVEGDEDNSNSTAIEGRNSNSFTTPPTSLNKLPTSSSSLAEVSWLYIAKSLLFISLSAILYSVSLKLTRRILESSDDRYLSASDDDGDEDDLNSETSSRGGGGGVNGGGIPAPAFIGVGGKAAAGFHSYSNRNFHSNIAGVYVGGGGGVGVNSGGKPGNKKSTSSSIGSSAPGSPFRNV